MAPETRRERVESLEAHILSHYDDDKLQAFLRFVLERYVSEGVQELDDSKLPDLLTVKYRTVHDAMAELGSAAAIREAFVGFQRHLYERR